MLDHIGSRCFFVRHAVQSGDGNFYKALLFKTKHGAGQRLDKGLKPPGRPRVVGLNCQTKGVTPAVLELLHSQIETDTPCFC